MGGSFHLCVGDLPYDLYVLCLLFFTKGEVLDRREGLDSLTYGAVVTRQLENISLPTL